jgi:Holliday junction resolvase
MHGPRPPEHHPSLKGKRGGRASRQKGNRTERALVKYLQDRGFAAERVPLSGSVRGRFGGDISVPLIGADRRVEVKVRGNGFARLYDWLEGNDFLIVRSDRREPLVVIPLKFAAEIASVAERRRDGVTPISPDLLESV